MNASTQPLLLMVDYWILATSSIDVLLSSGLFVLLIYHVVKDRNSPNRVALLLTANIYLALAYSSNMFVDQYIHVLTAHLYSFTSLNDGIFCQIRGYLHWVPLCAIFYSNLLQAIHRLCRIVFHTKLFYQSFQFYQILIVIQSLLCFLLPILTLLLGDFRYSSIDHNCENDSINLRSSFMNGSTTYVIPMHCTHVCYIYTWVKMRRGNNGLIHTMTQIQRMNVQRDLIVLFRVY